MQDFSLGLCGAAVQGAEHGAAEGYEGSGTTERPGTKTTVRESDRAKCEQNVAPPQKYYQILSRLASKSEQKLLARN